MSLDPNDTITAALQKNKNKKSIPEKIIKGSVNQGNVNKIGNCYSAVYGISQL
jgi:hypothetical protein